jgi:hypothetical protein
MATKLKFSVVDINTGVITCTPEGVLEAPNDYQLPHRFFYEDGVVKDKYGNKTDREVQEIDHEAAIALAAELGTTPPPPL